MFRLGSPGGKTILVDPWVSGSPVFKGGPEDLEGVDITLVTHGHFDHFAGIDDVCKASPEAKIIAPYELALTLMIKGKKNVYAMNKGGVLALDGLEISMVGADHSSSDTDFQKGVTTYLGEAVGYVIKFENDFKAYIAGDTGLMSEMKSIIADYHEPDLAVLPVSGLFVMDPKQAKVAAQTIGSKYVIPCHDFPEVPETADQEAYKKFLEQYPFIQLMIGKAKEFAGLMEEESDIQTIVVGLGEEKEI